MQQSIMSTRTDTGKVSQLFDKINSANNLEIEERSLKNIAQKVQLKLFDSHYLALNHGYQIPHLLKWLQMRHQCATTTALLSCYNILAFLATSEEGRQVLADLGAPSFLNEVLKCTDDESSRDVLGHLMSSMVNTVHQKRQEDTVSDNSAQANPFKTQGDFKPNHSIVSEDMNRTFNQTIMRETTQFTRTEFQVQQTVPKVQKTAPKSDQNLLHSAHMEILHKNQCLKEPCDLPFITLSEEDEKRIFDISVQLKFGDFRTVLQTVQQIDSILLDYPVEVLLQRTDTIKGLLDLLEGGSSGQGAYSNLSQQALVSVCKRLRQLYAFNSNPVTKSSHRSQAAITHQYLQLSYPPIKESLWNSQESINDLKKYGTSSSHDKMSHATLQGSLSCRAVLGLIITKSVYLLKDTEKIGLYIQLIKEALQSLVCIFRVRQNIEFTELLHLIVFAFDSVFEFYKDQIFEEVLICPALTLCLDFIKLLNSIPNSDAERFKNPFSETLFKNTERLQMTLRRCLFSQTMSQQHNQVIMEFFQRMESDLPQVNLLQKNVTQSFSKAIDALARFSKVHGYKLSGGDPEEMTFVESLPQLISALDILNELSHCIELKIEFPFEYLLLDCIIFSLLLADQNESQSKFVDEAEALFMTYLLIPIPEVRERIVRRMFQRIRIIQGLATSSRQKANNNYMLAKFCYRKKILNQFVNGMLINASIASEETKIQLSVGQVVVKILIVAYNEAGVASQKHQNLNQFLLTFQSLLPMFPDLIGLIDLIEENAQKNCRYLRILRDLFNRNASKREFSTSVLQSSISKDSKEQITDLVQSVVDLKDPTADCAADFDLVNLNFDYSNFDVTNITSILMNVKSDFGLRKSSLEQLTMLLHDCAQKRGKTLFTNFGVDDCFSFVISEILAAYKTSKTYMNEQLSELPQDHINYIDQCLKFIVSSYVFFQEEPVVKQFFDKIRTFSSQKATGCEKFESVLNALIYYAGYKPLRRHSMRLLYLIVLSPFWLRVKIQKSQAHASRTKRTVELLVPDFCLVTFLMIVPYQEQSVKQPQREDLLLSDEQRTYITSMLNKINVDRQNSEILSQVGQNFSNCKSDDFNQTMQAFETVQNYLLSLSEMRVELISDDVLARMQELLRILPTKPFEFNFLADYIMFLNQILVVLQNIQGEKLIEAFVKTLIESLHHHLLPYLFEVGCREIEQNLVDTHSPRLFFLNQFLDLLLNLANADLLLHTKYRLPSRMSDRIISNELISYLSDLYILLKDKNDHRRKILSFLYQLIVSYDTRRLKMERVSSMLVGAISQFRLSNNFEGSSQVIISIRTFLTIYQRGLTHVDVSKRPNSDLDQFVSLSETANKALTEFHNSGWLIRLTESRDARLRCLSWDLLSEMFDFDFFKVNQSLCWQALNSILREELYCVKIAVLKFVNKLCECLMQNCTSDQDGTEDQVSVRTLLNAVGKQGLISHVHAILSQRDCPLLMISLFLRLISKLVKMDSKRSLPILTQLDYWTLLVELLDTENLKRQDQSESRPVIAAIKKSQLKEASHTLDQVYMCVNSILEFVFEAMKKDTQLASLLVKTTKLLPQVFKLAKTTLDFAPDLSAPRGLFQNQGLILIFVDKIVKLLHLALLHPRDYTVTQLHHFLSSCQDEQLGWHYIIKMFEVVGSQQSIVFQGHIDVKLSICRLVAEYLTRINQTPYADNTQTNLDSLQHSQKQNETYGGSLLLEFGKVFRALYVDQRDSRRLQGVPDDLGDHENSKIDICLSLMVLTASSATAKVQSVEQNLLKKVIEICDENVQALHLQELQKLSQRSSKQPLGNLTRDSIEMQRRFKYANFNDTELGERETIRMLGVIRHIIFKSGRLLQDLIFESKAEDNQKSFISQNAMTKSTTLRIQKQKEVALGERLQSLFGLILEHVSKDTVIEECLQTMTNLASQNNRFKISFIAQCSGLTQSKKNTVLKVVADILMREPFQSNSKRLRLMFAFLRSVAMSPEVVKEISKMRMIEELQSLLEPACKNEKDIKLLKNWLMHYTGFLAGFAWSEEGKRTVMKLKPTFEMSLFVIDTITPPVNTTEVTPLTHLVLNILLFLRNSSMVRGGKLHFIGDRAFLPCLLAFLSSRQQHPRVRAYVVACLWSTLFNHQGVKAALNSVQVRSELQLLQSEFQRCTDISTYAEFVRHPRQPTSDAGEMTDKSQEKEGKAISQMEHFTLIGLNGILSLLEA